MKILITGGSRGLGLALGKYFAAQDFEVVTCAKSQAPQVPGVRHISGVDLRREDSMNLLLPELATADALINNVGIAYDGLLVTQGLGNVREMLEVNLLSILHITKMYLRERVSHKKSGSIVSISSIISKRGFAGLSTYAATKGAINSMTQALAREMGGKGFRINAVLPGYFESELSKDLSDSKRQQIIRRTPLGRLANTDDICPVVGFLLSDSAKFITGQLLTVDGGLTV